MKLKILFLLMSTIAIISCDKLNPTVKFDHTATEVSFEVPANADLGAKKFAEKVITNDIKPTLEANGVSVDQIKSVKVKSINFTITQSTVATTNFDFASSLETYLSMSGNETKFASKDPVPTGSSSIDLDVNSDVDLATYLKSTSFTFTVKGTQKAANPAMTIVAKIVYTVEATVKK